MNARTAAALTLGPVLRREASLQSVFEPNIRALPAKEKALFHELVYGTLRKFEWLDATAKQFLTKKLKNKDQDVYALILIGIYQLEYLRTPDHAAISATVDASKTLKKAWAKNMINAVLRKVQRQRESGPDARAENNAATYLLPEWIIKQLKQDWGEQGARDIGERMQSKAPLTARINTHRISRQDALNTLAEHGVQAQACAFSKLGLHISEHGGEIGELPGFKQAWLSIQDEAAQLAASLLDLAPQQVVLDACAAPGGKTAAILEAQTHLESVTSIDIDATRCASIKETLDRLQLHANIRHADASDTAAWWDGRYFDRILLDAPCSASGVIRRHPDIKLLRQETDLAELAAHQKLLLNTLWPTLKPGGVLLYATCSIFKCENEDQVQAFLDRNDDAIEIDIDAAWGQAQKVGRQLLPHAGGHDGFYYAKLQKRH